MIKTITACTKEIDYADEAVEEILEQLDIENNLLENSVGIVTCIPDFILESDILANLSEVLPFDIIGSTTIATSVNASDEPASLSLIVFTSDNLKFKTLITDPVLTSDSEQVTAKLKNAISEEEQDSPDLAIIFAPLLPYSSGDFMLEAVETVLGDTPIFGMTSVDNTEDYRNTYVIHNGEALKNVVGLLLIYGDINPKFYLATLSNERIFSETGIITSVDENQIKEVNNAPASDFLEFLGIEKDEKGNFVAVNTFPLIVDFNDGSTPVIRAMFDVSEEGYAIAGGRVPEGSILSVGYYDEADIMKSSGKMLSEVPLTDETNGILVFSCIGRYLHLGLEPDKGIKKLHEAIDNKGIPYLLAYAGGEFCPVKADDSDNITDDNLDYVNRFHNCTMVVCVF